MITYKPHPWVSSVKFKMIDENHIRILINPSVEGKDATLEYNHNSIGKCRHNFVFSKSSPNGLGGYYDNYLDEELCLILPDPKWRLIILSIEFYNIEMIFVKSSVEDKEDYWTEAEIE